MICVEEASKQLGVSKRRVRALAIAGRILGAKKLNNTWVFPVKVIVSECSSGPKLRVKSK